MLPSRFTDKHDERVATYAGSTKLHCCTLDGTLTRCTRDTPPPQNRFSLVDSLRQQMIARDTATPWISALMGFTPWSSHHLTNPSPQTLRMIKTPPPKTRFLGAGLNFIIFVAHLLFPLVLRAQECCSVAEFSREMRRHVSLERPQYQRQQDGLLRLYRIVHNVEGKGWSTLIIS